MTTRWLCIGLATVGLLVSLAANSMACSVPVFRYALERWRPDPYFSVVFHRGPLTAEQQRSADLLGKAGRSGEKVVNLNLHTVDLDKLDPKSSDDDKFMLEQWQKQKTDVLPWVVIDFPIPTKGRVFQGPLAEIDKKKVAELIDSPIRQQIAKKILAGETGVFVLLESGNKETDDKAAKLLTEQLAKLAKTMKLPEVDAADVAQGLISVDPDKLKIAFTVIRLKRDAPQEKAFINVLLGSDADYDLKDKEFDGDALVFPVFGRGRCMPCLIGQGINEDQIGEVAASLCQSCTCEIKNQNPGIDLLMAVDWDSLVEIKEVDQELPPLLGLGQFVNPKTKPKSDPTATDGKPAKSDPDGVAESKAVVGGTQVASVDGNVDPPTGVGPVSTEPSTPDPMKDERPSDQEPVAAIQKGKSTNSESASAGGSETASGKLMDDTLMVALMGGILVVVATIVVASRRG
ncbi:MAG: hypothetical protein O3A00_25950 [Planctomycetota bacterium]|nr:hypothetical protein [Planctomycetota bacterium]